MTSHFFILFESLLDTTETTTRHKIAYAPNYKSDSSLQKQGVFFSRERELQKSVVVNYVVQNSYLVIFESSADIYCVNFLQ